MNAASLLQACQNAWRHTVALGRGVARAIAYSEHEDHPEVVEVLRLCSAIDHLRRGISVDYVGQPYLDRITAAPAAMLQATLTECGCTEADVARWQKQYAKESTTPALGIR